jgi:hypothetical protein
MRPTALYAGRKKLVKHHADNVKFLDSGAIEKPCNKTIKVQM